jgi:subtilisin family serine protease
LAAVSRATKSLAFCLILALAACAPTEGPRPGSSEARLSWGLRAVRAQAAYDRGLTGRGVTVAIIDCGVESDDRELSPNLSPASIDLVPRRDKALVGMHGVSVAGPLGAIRNGAGVIGVAYNATILSIRADFDGGYAGQCAFYPSDLARALDYATANKARIAVLAVQGSKSFGPKFESALARATASGMAIVFAAGNDADHEPAWPARYAGDPRFAGSIVVVGAQMPDGDQAPWSNRAGRFDSYYLIAPGDHIVTNCRLRSCDVASGTSVAAPYVAGALALVMEEMPAISAPAAIAKVLDAARPMKELQDVGRGALDISRLFLSTTAAGAAG